jgi:hypothetical protein
MLEVLKKEKTYVVVKMDIITYKSFSEKTIKNKNLIEFKSLNNKENNNIIKYLKSEN